MINFTDKIYNQALIFIEDQILKITGKPLSEIGIISPSRQEILNTNKDILMELSYSSNEMLAYVAENKPLLNSNHRLIYNDVLQRYGKKKGGIIFMDAPGGTEKTFLINLLLARISGRKKIALAVASSGIAATLLTGGRTAHSTLQIPIDLIYIHGNDETIGGLIVVLAGDFCQTLPVIPKGTMVDEIKACLK